MNTLLAHCSALNEIRILENNAYNFLTRIAPQDSLCGLPTSFFIDSEGILQRIQNGAILKMKPETFISEILPKKNRLFVRLIIRYF